MYSEPEEGKAEVQTHSSGGSTSSSPAQNQTSCSTIPSTIVPFAVELVVEFDVAVALDAVEEILAFRVTLDEVMMLDDWNEVVNELVVVVEVLPTMGGIPLLLEVVVVPLLILLVIPGTGVGDGLAGRVRVDDWPRTRVEARRLTKRVSSIVSRMGNGEEDPAHHRFTLDTCVCVRLRPRAQALTRTRTSYTHRPGASKNPKYGQTSDWRWAIACLLGVQDEGERS